MSATATDSRRTIAQSFADALTYPGQTPQGDIAARLPELVADAEIADLLAQFDEFTSSATLGELQESYTRTFDLDTMSRAEPTCYPYVGHHLFDDNHKRGALILGLRKRFRAIGFDEGTEVADHLVVLLRFLAVTNDAEQAEEIIVEAILPALSRMRVASTGDAERPWPGRAEYLGVLRALELALAIGREAAVDAMETEAEREWLRDRDSLGIDRDTCGH